MVETIICTQYNMRERDTMQIVINADDYGMTKNCSDAIIKSFNKSLIDTTTMIVNCEAFDYAVEKAYTNKISDKIGIHFNLTQGIPVTEKIKSERAFCNNEGVFHGHINKLQSLSNSQKLAVYEELKAQLQIMKDNGFKIHHADSHHHVHTAFSILPIVKRICIENGIGRLRIARNVGNIKPIKLPYKMLVNLVIIGKLGYSEKFGSYEDYLRGKKVDSLLEVMCHPDYSSEGILIDRNKYISGMAYGSDLNSKHKALLQLYEKT